MYIFVSVLCSDYSSSSCDRLLVSVVVVVVALFLFGIQHKIQVCMSSHYIVSFLERSGFSVEYMLRDRRFEGSKVKYHT